MSELVNGSGMRMDGRVPGHDDTAGLVRLACCPAGREEG